MTNKAKDIISYFDIECKDAKCSLVYFNDYTLLLAIMLSAQCSDKKVNEVTELIFKKYKSLQELNNLDLDKIEEYLKPLGLYKNKAKYFKEIVNVLLEKYDGIVPKDKKILIKLPGVGNKTASVFLAEFYNLEEFPVDTHINRISKRLGIAKNNDSVLDVEKNLKKLFPKDKWVDLHHKFIYFGRNRCNAISPNCLNCSLKKYCNYKK